MLEFGPLQVGPCHFNVIVYSMFGSYSHCFMIVEKIMEISSTTGVLVDPVYNIKAVRGLLTEMKNNPHRFKGRRILYIHTGELNFLAYVTGAWP